MAMATQAEACANNADINPIRCASHPSPQVLELPHQVLELLFERARDGCPRALAAAAGAAPLTLERLQKGGGGAGPRGGGSVGASSASAEAGKAAPKLQANGQRATACCSLAAS